MRLPRFLARALGRAQAKALTITRDGFVPRASIDQRIGYGNQRGFDSNVIMAPVAWIMRTFTEGVARVERRTNGTWTFVDDHPVELLIDEPNPFYGGDELWKATCLSYAFDGNAYWRKVRNAIGDVLGLYYTPHWLMKPHSPEDGSALLDYWEYHHGFGPPDRLLPRDVVHFRFGLDPCDMRLGFSPLKPLVREIMTDDEAARFSYSILSNMGIPGVMISQRNPSMGDVPPAEVERLKEYIASTFTGMGRGDTLVFGQPTDVTAFGFDPSKMTLPDLRNISEERVCAMLGLPGAVVGFGSGLETTKVGATMKELRELAWVQCLHPMQRSMGRQLDRQLLPDFQAQTRRFRVAFDLSDAASFSETAKETTERCAAAVTAGFMRVDQAQEICGIEKDDTQRVYLRSFSTVAVGEDADAINQTVAEAHLAGTPEPTPPPSNGASTGAGTDPTAEGKADLDALHAIALRRGYVTNGSGNGKH